MELKSFSTIIMFCLVMHLFNGIEFETFFSLTFDIEILRDTYLFFLHKNDLAKDARLIGHWSGG